MKLKNILFPTDFSENAQKALPFALEISRRSGADLTILHSITESYDLTPMVKEKRETREREITSRLHKMIEDIHRKKEYKDIPIDTAVLSGSTVYSILEETYEHKIDLIVMGTKGATGPKKVVFGSNTTEILQKAKSPVLIIPEQGNYYGLDHITFSTDYHEGDPMLLESISSLASLFGSAITVVHIAPENNLKSELMFRGFRELMKEQLAYKLIDFKLIINSDYHTGLIKYMSYHTTQMLIVVRYKKSFFKPLLEKDYTKQLGFYVNIPLLVLPEGIPLTFKTIEMSTTLYP